MAYEIFKPGGEVGTAMFLYACRASERGVSGTTEGCLMYRPKDTYVHGAQVDAIAEAELREWSLQDREAEQAAYAAEDAMSEFLPIWRIPEEEPDPNELHHDRWLHMPEGF